MESGPRRSKRLNPTTKFGKGTAIEKTPSFNNSEVTRSRREGSRSSSPMESGPRRSKRLNPTTKFGIGTVIEKKFFGIPFLGKVTVVSQNRYDYEKWYGILYKIHYDDGDVEDLSEQEIEDVVIVKKISGDGKTVVDDQFESSSISNTCKGGRDEDDGNSNDLNEHNVKEQENDGFGKDDQEEQSESSEASSSANNINQNVWSDVDSDCTNSSPGKSNQNEPSLQSMSEYDPEKESGSSSASTSLGNKNVSSKSYMEGYTRSIGHTTYL